MHLNTPIAVHSKNFLATAFSGGCQNLWHPSKIQSSSTDKIYFELSLKKSLFFKYKHLNLMIKYSCIVLLIASFTSCRTLSVQQERQMKTTQNIQLGTIGVHKNFMLEQDYNFAAFPQFQHPIKVQVNGVPFNKAKLKAFENAKRTQNKSVVVKYVDSVKPKPHFLKLEIADRVAVLKSLNSEGNKDVFQFLQTKSNAHLVSTISVVFDAETAAKLSTAQEVFLEHTGINNYVLKTYDTNKEQHSIHFSEGVVFGYQTSKACWKENKKRQLEIVDFVESDDRCPIDTHRLAKKAKKKINYKNF